MGSVVSSILDPITGAGNVKDAANTAAEQQRQAGLTAANISAFRPVGMTTRFGSSQFTREIDPATGVPYISGASYQAAPELAALQESLFGQFQPSYAQAQQMGQQYAPLGTGAQSLFNLGQQYLATSPDQAAQDYIAQQQALLAAGDRANLAQTRSSLFGTGRGGLGVQTGTGSAPASPEMQAYYNAIAQQDLQLAAQAEQASQQRQIFGAGLFGTGAQLLGTQASTAAGAYSPLQTLLGTSGQVETMSQMPYQLGIQLGQAAQPGQTAGSQMYQSGMNQAAQTQYGATQAANAANAGFWGGLISAAGTAYAGKK